MQLVTTDTRAATIEYSVRPIARAAIDPNDERLDMLLDVLIADGRALGASGVAISEDGEIFSTFQVALAAGDELDQAVQLAMRIFDGALEQAGINARTSAVAAVEGDDPERLP